MEDVALVLDSYLVWSRDVHAQINRFPSGFSTASLATAISDREPLQHVEVQKDRVYLPVF